MEFHERNIYLSNVEVNQALELMMEAVKPCFKNLKRETVKVIDSLIGLPANRFLPIFFPQLQCCGNGRNCKGQDTYAFQRPCFLKQQDFIYIDTGDLFRSF